MSFRKDQDPTVHIAAMRRYAQALCRDEERADDLVQNALVNAYAGASSFRDNGSLRNWLLSIVRNSFLGDLRRRKAEKQRHDHLVRELTGQVEPEQEHRAYLYQLLERFLQLPESQREVLYLISIEEMSYQEAAAFLDVPVGTIMSRLSRARAQLREIEAGSEKDIRKHLKLIAGGDA